MVKKYSNPNRALRMADQIREDIMDIIRTESKDPRLSSMVTINDVEMSVDNSVATVYWVVLDVDKKNDVEKALLSSKGFIRTQLSKRFTTYTIADLEFVYDDSLERGDKILSILNELQQYNK